MTFEGRSALLVGRIELNILETKLVFFSPTETTKNISLAIAKGINSENVAIIDYTRSITRINTPPRIS
jgi:hypothetical protein